MAEVEWVRPVTPEDDAPEPLRGADWLVRRSDGKAFRLDVYGRRPVPGNPGDPAVLVSLATEWAFPLSRPLVILAGEAAAGPDARARINAAIEQITDKQIRAQEFDPSTGLAKKLILWVVAATVAFGIGLAATVAWALEAERLPRAGASPCEAGEIITIDEKVTIDDSNRQVSLDRGTYTVRAVEGIRWIPKRFRSNEVTLRRDARRVIDEVTVSERSLQEAKLC